MVYSSFYGDSCTPGTSGGRRFRSFALFPDDAWHDRVDIGIRRRGRQERGGGRSREASRTALRLAMRGLNASFQSDLPSMLTLEGALQSVALSSDYLVEATRRFASKEPRRFNWPAA